MDTPYPFPLPFQRLKMPKEKVLAHLISNAIKYSPAKGEVTAAITLPSADKVRVTITDQGKGIPPEFQRLIFQKFAQADSSITRLRGGTGLGLHISKTIIEKLGGTIGFTTQLTQGTSFYFEFPTLSAQSMQENHDESAVK